MAYTPQLSESAATTLQRISWAVGKPMAQTIEGIFKKLPTIMDSKEVCRCCKDHSKCSFCAFNDREAA